MNPSQSSNRCNAYGGKMSLLLGRWKEPGPDAYREEESCLQRLVHHLLGLLGSHLHQDQNHGIVSLV